MRIALLLCWTSLALCALGRSQSSSPEAPKVTTLPESFFALVREPDRVAARAFYQKFIDVEGMPVVASGEVSDLALQRTHGIVTHLLAGRPDVLAAMIKRGMYLIIIGKDQRYTDMPEYRNSSNPEYMNERVRGTGGQPTSFGEENLLSLPLDRYDDESIGVHEFCHTIDSALRTVDPTWSARKDAAFRAAIAKGLWKNTYAASSAGEFWAEAAQSYFDCNRVNNWNHGPVGTCEQLHTYDPDTYALVHEAFNLSASQDWRYTFLRKLPNVEAQPKKFGHDPFYTKFTWAREFTVLGRGASDEALLRANDTIRKMFAYRHDILKAVIAEGVKLVVLGRAEAVSSLPEEYTPTTKTMVVGEEDSPTSSVIGVFARALYRVTANRPVDPNWNNRGRDVQQYELRVKRLDIEFGNRVTALFGLAIAKGLWKGTTAHNDAESYWVEGVLAYFDATGSATRERLRQNDPDLFALVHKTMAYEGHVDWRYGRPG